MSTKAPTMHQYPDDPQFAKASPTKIGMWVFLTTDAMSFSGLLIAYAVLRATRPWPNPVEALGGVELSGLMTFLLICSSVSMVMAVDAAKRKHRQEMLNWLLVTIGGGATFLSLQVYEYAHLINDLGMTLTSYAHGDNLFASTFLRLLAFTVCTFLRARFISFICMSSPIKGVLTMGIMINSKLLVCFGTSLILYGFLFLLLFILYNDENIFFVHIFYIFF